MQENAKRACMHDYQFYAMFFYMLRPISDGMHLFNDFM